MAYGYLPVDRDQLFLLPPDMREWLPEDHLAWFVIEVVERVDTSALHARHPAGPGRPAYDPDVLLALLIYAYATGVRSSRQVERLCETDVAYRVIAANSRPDHTTFARFRQDHAPEAQRLFVDVLELCAAAGLASAGVVALDGTKFAANASKQANRTRAKIEAQVGEMFAAAERADRAEDEQHGTTRGDEPPAVLRGRTARLARLDAALRLLESQRQASAGASRQAKAARQAEQGRRLAGRKPKGLDVLAEAEAGLAAEKARDAARRARRAAREEAADAAGKRLSGRRPQAVHPRVARAEQRLAEAKEHAEPSPQPPEARANTTDPDSRLMKTAGGYLQGYNAQAVVNEQGVVLAAEVVQDHNDVHQFLPMVRLLLANLLAVGLVAAVGTVLCDAGYWSDANATAQGPDRLIATARSWRLRRKAREEGPTSGPPPEGAGHAAAMEHRLLSEEGSRLYARRSVIVEPLFGQHKEVRGYQRFVRRGCQAADAEWKLINAAHNVNKLYRARLATA